MPEGRIVLVCPNPAIEVTYFCKRLSLHAQSDADYRVAAGGKSINVARVLRVLRSEPVLLTCLGGIFGNFIHQQLVSSGIECGVVSHFQETRISTVIYEENETEATVVRSDGPVLPPDVQSQFIDLVASYLSATSIVCMAGSLPHGFSASFVETICQIASYRNARIIVDVSGQPLLSALRAKPFLVKGNRTEISSTFGAGKTGTIDARHLLEIVVSAGAQNALVTSGREGWIAFVDGHYLRGAIEPNPKGFDIGAGDAMTAGILHYLNAGYSLVETLQFATKVAAASTFCRSSGEVDEDKIYAFPPCLIEEL